MLFDDRLATVLRSTAHSELAARTQFRQLLDLLGSMPHDASSELLDAAYDRLGELSDALPPTVQSAIMRAPGLRLRNRALVAWLAEGEPQAAAAAMATAQLSESDWLYLIPRLPMRARGFLRHRRDLPFSAKQVLDRLGVRDLVLPQPEQAYFEFPPAPETTEDEETAHPEAEAGIGAIVRRIEAFQRARREGGPAPRLPLGDSRELEADRLRRGGAFDFACDAQGVVGWADPAMAPLVVGLVLGPRRPGAVASLDEAGVRALARRLPLRAARTTLLGPAEIAGDWRVDAAPVFDPATGQFAGYQGRMRRWELARRPGPARPDTAGKMRQVLHELRTPVNAIQGFAELIQQQMFGAAPNEYRALAAAVAVDAARLMAGFDEIDRLARLESGALQLEEGRSDLHDVLVETLRRLEGVLKPRSARIELIVEGAPFTVGIERTEALQLIWRFVATQAGALAPGEIVDLKLHSDGAYVTVDADLPAAMMSNGDLFAASAPPAARAVSAGMFGSGFTFRLARAEAEAAGGTLDRHEDCVRLVLPVLTAAADAFDREGGGGSTAA